VDLETAETLIDIDQKEPTWWVWVPDSPSNIEERSEIDNENYVIVSEEHVVDGVANFVAKCILSNSKAKVSKELKLLFFQIKCGNSV
jgi:hypothetical protein